MRNILWVGAGGAIGSVARYLVGLAIPGRVPGFPWNTFMVNVSGAFLLGLAAGFFGDRLPVHLRLFVAVGITGGFTTFSTWALDTVELARAGRSAEALLNLVIPVAAGLAAAVLGLVLGLAAAGSDR